MSSLEVFQSWEVRYVGLDASVEAPVGRRHEVGVRLTALCY